MSIAVKHLVIHYLQKQEGQTQIHLRSDELPINEKVTQFVSQLHHSYSSKPAKGYCVFIGDKNPQFAEGLQAYRRQELPFYHFVTNSTDVLKQELDKYAFDESGYLVFCHYQFMASDYLLITLVNIKEHYALNSELEINASRHLDMTSMNLAARIDLTAMVAEPDSRKYISFIRGRAGRKVADFFLDFLGCEEGVDAKAQSQAVVSVVEEYLQEQQFDKYEKDQARHDLFAYCKEKISLGEEANLTELAQVVAKEEAERFESFYQAQGYQLEDEFPIDKKTVSNMVKFSGSGKGVSISFERKLLGDRVIYDPQSDRLTIIGIPPNLKDQLTRAE